MRYKNERLVSFVITTLAIVAFLFVAAYTVIWATGIRYNIKTGTIEQTVLIAVNTKISGVTVDLNGKVIAKTTPTEKRDLEPGHYVVTLSKPGFLNYQKSFDLTAGQVGTVPGTVVLMASQPTVETNITTVKYVGEDPIDVGINITGGEISDNGNLVTRLSGDPVIVRRFNSGYLYQLNNQLRLYLPNNSQDVLVDSLPSDTPAKVNIDPGDWQVSVFNDNGAATVVHLTEPSGSSASSS